MRRAVSILLVLFFSLGPLSATLGAAEDSRLPACCQRHGAHHCAMAARMASILRESGETSFTAPTACPRFPTSFAATISTPHAHAAAAVSLPVPLAQPHCSTAARASARLSQVRTRAGRGPPALFLA